MNIEMDSHDGPIAVAPVGRYVPKGLICRLAMQCADPETGLVGDWLFAGDSWRDKGARVSPLFGDCVPVFRWAKAAGWEQVGDAYRKL